MTSIQIHLKDQTVITVENLTAIKIFYTTGTITLSPNDFEQVQIDPDLPYSFIGANESISIFGADLLYIRLLKD